VRLTVLGSGTGWIDLKRSSPGYLLSLENFHLLLDIGPGSLRQLLKTGLSLKDISALFVSHFHPDHIADLIPFFFATRYNLGYTRKEPFTLYTHKNFTQLYEGLKQAFGHWVCPPEGLLELYLVDREEFTDFEIGPFKARTVGVRHNPESLAIRLEFSGKSLIYSGDTGFSDELIELSRGGDLLILECANPTGVSGDFHLSPEEIAEISAKANPKKLLLSHFYPHSERVPLEIIKERFSGKVILARDLLTLEI
jgi:ribonuclease BN (tRNA processing enzyme)